MLKSNYEEYEKFRISKPSPPRKTAPAPLPRGEYKKGLMMFIKMPKEQMEHIMHKLYHKRNVKLEGFIINVILMIVAWLIMMIPGYENLLTSAMHTSPETAGMLVMDMFALWKILNVVFFLVPGLAAWWELCRYKKHM